MNWLEFIKPYTKRILINNVEKTITLVHPHFNKGQDNYRTLLKLLSQKNIYSQYTVECIGFASIKGFIILEHIEEHLKKSKNIEGVNLNSNLFNSTYNLQFKFK